jgi:hypothetical protein
MSCVVKWSDTSVVTSIEFEIKIIFDEAEPQFPEFYPVL